MKPTKIAIVIFALLVSVGVALFAFQFSPRSRNQNDISQEVKSLSTVDSEEVKNPPHEEIVDTSGWKTYRNEEYGIEFKYPPIQEGWTLEEYDYSKDSSLPYWPSRGVAVFYNPDHTENHRLGGLDINFQRSRWGSSFELMNTSRESTPVDEYTFNFQGVRAIAGSMHRDRIERFFSKNMDCDAGTVIFELPGIVSKFPKKKTNYPISPHVVVSFFCEKGQLTETEKRFYKTILGSIKFAER